MSSDTNIVYIRHSLVSSNTATNDDGGAFTLVRTWFLFQDSICISNYA